MSNPTSPRPFARAFAALLFFLATASLAQNPPPPDLKSTCGGKYQPEFKQLYALDEGAWNDLCRTTTPSVGKRKGSSRKREEIVAGQLTGGEQALQTGDFNALYDNGAAGGVAEPVAVPPSQTGTTLKAGPTAAKDKVGVPAAQDRISQNEIDAHFQFEAPESSLGDMPGVLGTVGGFIDGAVVQPVRGAFFSSKEKDFVKKMTDELQKSEEGRRILRGIISEGIVMKIEPHDFPGSPIVKNGDLEEIDGTRGEAIPDAKLYAFNSNFMKMKDQQVALESVASNMGHELNHVLLHARVKRIFNGEYHDVLDNALVDEQSARLKGYVVAYELNTGKPNGYIQEAKGMLQETPEAMWESMKLWSPAYARTLDLEEMKNPVPAYQLRLQALTDKRDELDDEGPELKAELRRIDHMMNDHGFSANLTELRKLYQSDLDTLPTRKQHVKESMDAVKERIVLLQKPEGKPLLDKFKKAAADPKFVKLFSDMQDDIKKLEDYRRTKPVPSPKPTPGQWSMKTFEQRWNQLHVDAPRQDPPWKEKGSKP